MRPSTIRKIYSFFVAFVLTAVATPDWALGRGLHRDSVEAADLSVMAVNKTDRRIEQIALREPDGIELDSDIFGYDGLAPRQWRAFTIPRGAGVCTYEISILFEAKKEADCCSDPLPIGVRNLCDDPRIVVHD